MVTKVKLPAGMTSVQGSGGKLVPDVDGTVTVSDADAAALHRIGATVVSGEGYGPTATRPATNTMVGQEFFDTTLNKPVWRNKTNTGWVDATGATV